MGSADPALPAEPSDPTRPPAHWTAPEQRLWHAFRTGSLCDLTAATARRARLAVGDYGQGPGGGSGLSADPRPSPSSPGGNGGNGFEDRDDPHGPAAWGPERTVRAEVLALLLLHGPPPVPGRVAALKLRGALITNRLDLSGGTVAPFVELRACRFDSELQLSETRCGTLRLVHCALVRLDASRLQAGGDLHLPGCRVARGVRLTDAHIGTDLLLTDARLRRDARGRALTADGLTVAQDLQADLLRAYGEVSLRGATIGGSMSVRGALISHPRGRRALNAPSLTVGRTLSLTSVSYGPGPEDTITPPYGTTRSPAVTDPGSASGGPDRRVRRFECRGGLRLDDGRFGDALDFFGARFALGPDQEISLRRIQTAELRFVGERPDKGRVVLSGATVGKLVDRAWSWPGPGRVALGGFSYAALAPRGPFGLAARLEWLANATPEYSPEPYERLAAVLRADGEDRDAREVLLAKQRRRRTGLPLAARTWGWVQDGTVAYGYRPGRAALWMAVLWAVGALAFSRHVPPPLKADEAPEWNPFLYALDLLLPVIDLGQEGRWLMTGAWQWATVALVLLGWILATTVAAGATRLLRRT
ncbi:oxidoreductase [Streptomyces sp. BI20]|uniref:oxidoreductase n=1 Tax=Streptomyces sp. BI20 TaxID=3403460 RepID=UPI003C73B911